MSKWWDKGIRFECQGSGKCCTSRGSYGYVYMTLSDRKRMAKHLKMNVSAFTKKYCEQHDGFYHLKDPQKDCFFLKDNKCTVYEGRPTQCRTWPFWPENMEAKSWNSEVVSFCPGVGKGKLYTAQEIEEIVLEKSMYDAEL
ncbi:MAG: YkgJ family cysteine cluster protein [Bacteriovoracia bacterium]